MCALSLYLFISVQLYEYNCRINVIQLADESVVVASSGSGKGIRVLMREMIALFQSCRRLSTGSQSQSQQCSRSRQLGLRLL